MKVGVLTIDLRLPENSSLKGKRQLIKPIIAQLKNRFDVSAAEVGDNDSWRRATLGVAYVSNDGRHANEVLSRAADFVSGGQFDVEVLDYGIEIKTFQGVR